MQVLSVKDKQLLKYSNDCSNFITDILKLEIKPFHREWLELFENNNYVALLAPRGHGKSTLVGSYILWRILRDPNIRILIVTINQDKANEMMTFIQNNLLGTHITDIWGNQKNPQDWSKSTLRVLKTNRPSGGKEPTLQVIGVSASMVGSHYDLIILDDITDQKNSRTPMRRNDLVSWYSSTLVPMLEPEGQIISIGTKWHQSDIHSFFQLQNRFKSMTYKAIIYDPSDEEKQNGKIPQVLWSDRWSYDKLMEIKREVGSVAFSMQYQNEVVSSDDAPIKWEWIENARNGYIIVKPPFQIYMGVDLSSKGEKSDFFAISVIAIKDGVVYLVDGLKDRLSMNEQFSQILKYDSKWRPIKIGVDSAAMQKAITDQLMEDNPNIPLVPIKPSIVNDRMSRVQRLSVLFETNRIYLKPDLVDYADELTMFPRGAHDDTIDSLSFALQASAEEVGPQPINWEIIPNMIITKRNKNRNVDTQRMYDVIKVG